MHSLIHLDFLIRPFFHEMLFYIPMYRNLRLHILEIARHLFVDGK